MIKEEPKEDDQIEEKKEPRKYADEQEKADMTKVNPKAISQMESMLKQLTLMKYDIALDVCCGAGEVIRDLLRLKFTEIDFFDQC